METKHNNDKLKIVPFKYVALRPEIAKQVLERKVTFAVNNNCDQLIDEQDSNPYKNDDIQIIENLRRRLLSKIDGGGYSATSKEIDTLYSKYGGRPFEKLLEGFIEDNIPMFVENLSESRNSGCIIVGYILDIINMIDEKTINYEEKIASVVSAIRNTRMSPYDMGVFIDDAEHLRGTGFVPREFYLDKEEVIRFKEAFLKKSNCVERNMFNEGYNADIVELFNRSGPSNN